MSKEAIEHYEAALKEAFPSGATGDVFHHWNEARKALAEQPAQPQQEPVAWLRKSDLVELRACNYMRLGADSPSIWAPNAPDEPSPDMELVAVYTSPPAQRTWVGLTDEEIERCMKQAYATVQGRNLEHAFARAIEAAHGIYAPTELKEKNT